VFTIGKSETLFTGFKMIPVITMV